MLRTKSSRAGAGRRGASPEPNTKRVESGLRIRGFSGLGEAIAQRWKGPGTLYTPGQVWRHRIFYLFVLPLAVLTLVFGIWPIVKSVQLSFIDSASALRAVPSYVGLDNYRSIFHDEYFWRSLRLTVVYTLICVPLNVVAAIGLALLARQLRFGGLFFKLAIFVPVVIPDIVSAIVWRWMFNTEMGSVNAVLGLFGIGRIAWLSSPQWVIPALVVVELWHHVGFYTIIILTNLQLIDPALYEVADLEGAGPWQRTWYVTVPELRPAIVLNTVYALIQFLKTFTVAMVITSGGPNYASNFLSYYSYAKFSKLEYGEATAMASVLFVLVLLVTGLTYFAARRKEA